VNLIHQHHIQRTGTVTKIIQEQRNRAGLAKDDNEAARLLKLAADQGDTKAQTELAELNKRLPK
jgi:TPR repeat protein